MASAPTSTWADRMKSKIHMDGVILEPTLYVDGSLRIEQGRFLVPIEER